MQKLQQNHKSQITNHKLQLLMMGCGHSKVRSMKKSKGSRDRQKGINVNVNDNDNVN